MTKKSNDLGRAFEFACINTFEKEISKFREVRIEKNSNYDATHRAWNEITDNEKESLCSSALASVKTIFELEPLILEDDDDILDLEIQGDQRGIEGDVRDVLFIRKGIQWEIGLSVKHNHFAVKHSRLSKNIDFGDKWFGIKCSDQYWKDVNPIFSNLEKEKKAGTEWRDLPSKWDDVYVPLLQAFLDELNRSYSIHENIIPSKMVEYLLGHFDFYKVIGIDNEEITEIQTFNLRGTLNKSSKQKKPEITIPISNLPTRIVSADFNPDRKNVVEVYFDAGWQFNFRIHNASSKVEPSLKFDINIIGMPTTIISMKCRWK